jgi:hypothetical protein
MRPMHVTIASISLGLWNLCSFTALSLLSPISLIPAMVREDGGGLSDSEPTKSGSLRSYPLLPSYSPHSLHSLHSLH